ncbi:MAG TPA: alpha-L-fucosidase [Bryobacteraceae bacterium]|nr:alpha-L-fucosidase [Bryobacteraceae bacterium]
MIRRYLLCAACLSSVALSQPAADTSAATANALRRFDDVKFGMFIHWGLYAIPAGEWKGRYVRGIGEWIMFREKIPVAEYEQLARQFNPVKFDADAWAQLAQDAGMRYMVITSKHHDGFAMFGSKASKYNIVDATPWGRDPMKPLSAACARRGIGFGFYYSQDQDWHEAGGRGNNWDFPEKRDSQPYLTGKVIPQLKELLTGYGKLALIWFDTPGLLSEQQVTELRTLVKSAQPSCLINSRIGHNRHDYTQTGDNAIPIQVYTQDGKFEVPATLNDTWGYKKNDQNWKEPRDLIAKLADIVSKGGNYLLNVGPTAEGVIPPASQQILRTIGKWLRVNGESIYGTSPSPFFFPDITWRATVKPGKLYIHILNWPGTKFRFEGLESRVRRAYFLANKAAVPFTVAGKALEFRLPERPVDPFDTVIVVEFDGNEPRVAPENRAGQVPARVDLYSWIARLRGEEIRYDWNTQSATNFRRFERETNSLWWYPYKSLEGDFDVEVTYSCPDAQAGSSVRLAAVQRGRPPASTVAGAVEGTRGAFVTKKLAGRLTVARDTEYISFELTSDDKSAPLQLRRITLSRVR